MGKNIEGIDEIKEIEINNNPNPIQRSQTKGDKENEEKSDSEISRKKCLWEIKNKLGRLFRNEIIDF